MSLAAGSGVSVKPASTLAGFYDGAVCGFDASAEESDKGKACLSFETKLKLSEFKRDKRNEERKPSYDKYIRINSKTLQRSYEIPEEEIYPFLKRLHRCLVEGFNEEHLVRSKPEAAVLYKKRRKIDRYFSWVAFSDFTVQVFPKEPSVLWLDLDCLTCKANGAETDGRKKHFRSQKVIRTVLEVVLELTEENDGVVTDGVGCGRLFVTRGKTCGMHLFFPDVLVNTEPDILHIWDRVNKRLAETGQENACIDSGCSSIPLPMSRNHNGLTEVTVTCDPSSKHIEITAHEVTNLTTLITASITNFYHLVSENIKKRSSSPSVASSVVTGISSTTNGLSHTGSVKQLGPDSVNVPDRPEDVVVVTASPPSTVVSSTEEGSIGTLKRKADADTTTTTAGDIKIYEDGPLFEKTKSNASTSSSSTSSKRLCQTDIREICAKVQEKRKMSSSQECDATDDSLLRNKKQKYAASGISSVESSPGKMPPNQIDYDSSSSFICNGYEPSRGPYTLNKFIFTDDEISLCSDRTRASGSKTPDAVSTLRCGQKPDTPAALKTGPGFHLSTLVFKTTTDSKTNKLAIDKVAEKKMQFENNVRLHQLERTQNQVYETDIQLLISAHNKEVDFYTSMMDNATPVQVGAGLWIKPGSRSNAGKDDCPTTMFTANVPRVLFSGDFVDESEWITVLERYFDDYLNSAPFLFIMKHVMSEDPHVHASLGEASIKSVYDALQNCLHRFESDAVHHRDKSENQMKRQTGPVHPSTEKCTVVVGLIAVCSMAFKMVTPVFTDLTKVCRVMLGNGEQTLKTLNASTMCTATNNMAQTAVLQEDDLLDDSVSTRADNDADNVPDWSSQQSEEEEMSVAASLGNIHSVLASILRWNHHALGEDTSCGLFFYYYHVHRDVLERILDEVLHGGLMVTAVLQSYFELHSKNKPVDFELLSEIIDGLAKALLHDDRKRQDQDSERMPPPKGGRAQKKGGKKNSKVVARTGGGQRVDQFEDRPEDAKRCQRELQAFNRHPLENEVVHVGEYSKPLNKYNTSSNEITALFINRYIRPVKHDDTTLVYTEKGYEPHQNEVFPCCTKDVFNKSTVLYQMTHGEIVIYNTDIRDTTHQGCFCSNNLVLNIFENVHGGCMTYLTRRFNSNLEIIQRFNADAYLLVVECRHAMTDFVRSVELSYINLILRQPIVPPVLESDITIRDMFMSHQELMKGSFVCLNAMDYVRCINMFTRHSNFSQENCKVAESFLDTLIINQGLVRNTDEEANYCFRTVYLFFLLFIFEVLYKIQHTYHRDNTYYVSIEQLSRSLGVRSLLKLFFGEREYKSPAGLASSVAEQLDMSENEHREDINEPSGAGNKVASTRFINTNPLISVAPPDKTARMMELFGKKGILVMKSCTPHSGETAGTGQETTGRGGSETINGNNNDAFTFEDTTSSSTGSESNHKEARCFGGKDLDFMNMAPVQLEARLYSNESWYENCLLRLKAVQSEQKSRTFAENKCLDFCLDQAAVHTILRTQLRVNVDNARLDKIETAVLEKKDFAFCAHMPLRTKVIALVMATHCIKRLTHAVASEFVQKEYSLERAGVVRFRKTSNQDSPDEAATSKSTDRNPEVVWDETWERLLIKRKRLLVYCRSLVDTYFPDSYFFGLRPDDAYEALYNYMARQEKYTVLQSLKNKAEPWAKNVCVALNYLLVMNAYDPELAELCLRLFLGFEWPGQWAKRIFVWKSNSNAGKSYFFEHMIRTAFDQSTTINDPKNTRENAPEKSDYYKNFVLMINEFSIASAAELKKLCSTSSYKFRLNFSNKMINAFTSGKMVFNCNTLPLTTDHATIQRVALIPLPFWFEKRQTVVDSMLNWTRSQSKLGEYEKNFRRNISRILNTDERQFFVEHTKNESDLFNKPSDMSIQTLGEINEQNVRSSMFLVQNKTSQVYMSCSPPITAIVKGITLVTRYFCRFRFFNSIKEPVDYSVLPNACLLASQEWQKISQPYFDWKDQYNVKTDYSTSTKVSVIHASLQHFAKNFGKNISFFDLRQFFEWEFAEYKIPNYKAKEDEYHVRLDQLQD